jgi:hypothetical protein
MNSDLQQALSMLKTQMIKLNSATATTSSGDPDVDAMTSQLTGLMNKLMSQLDGVMSQPNMPSAYNPPSALSMGMGAESCPLCSRPCPSGAGVCGPCSGCY